MNADKRTSACEDGCGCRLMTLLDADENGEPWETAAVSVLPGALEAVAAHTPARCRAIRALREAGERAAGENGSAFVLDEHSSFRVRAWDGASCWAECPVPQAFVVDVERGVLDWYADELERLLRDALADPASVAHRFPTAAPIIARDPHLGRTS